MRFTGLKLGFAGVVAGFCLSTVAETWTVGDWTLSGGGKAPLALAYRGRRVMSDVQTGYWTDNYRSGRLMGRLAFARREGETLVFTRGNDALRLEFKVTLASDKAKFTLAADFLQASGPFEYGFALPFDELAVAEGVPNMRLDGEAVELYRDSTFVALQGRCLAFELPEAKLTFGCPRSRETYSLQDLRKNGKGGMRFIRALTVDRPQRLVFEHEWTVEARFDAAETKCREGKLKALFAKETLPLENAGFESGRGGWNFTRNSFVDGKVSAEGTNAACIVIADPKKDTGVYITRQVPVVGGAEYRIVAKVRTENVREAVVGGKPSTGANVIIEWDDKNRKWLLSGEYSRGLWGTNDWTVLRTGWATAPVDAGYAAVFLSLRGTGKAWFDDVRVERRLMNVDKLEPVSGAKLENNCPRFVWGLRPGVRRYTVELSQDPSFPEGKVLAYPAGGRAGYQLETPLAPGRWYWRVSATGAVDADVSFFDQTASVGRDCLPPLLKTMAARVTAADAPFVVRVKDAPTARATLTFAGVTAKFVRVGDDGLAEYRFDAPAGGWKPGLTADELVAVDAAGNRGTSRFWLNVAPKPANDAVIAADGNFAVAGKRFFPLGIYEVAPKYMAEVRAAGYDVVHTYRWESSQDDVACTRYLDACWAADGLRAFVGFDRRSIVRGEFEHIARRVGAIGAHPGLFCWYLFDEPEIKNQFVAPDQLTACADLIRQLDPYHAVVMSTWNKTMDEYRGSWDTHWTQAYGDPAGVVGTLAEQRGYLKNCPSPITLLVNCNDGALGRLWKKGITPDPEKFSKDYDYLRACAFLGIVKECNGVWWWWFARDTRDYFTAAQAPKAWANLVKVVKELVSLRPIVDAEGPVRTGTVKVGKDKVEWWTKTVAGRTSLIVVNTANHPVEAEIVLPDGQTRRFALRRYEVKVERDVASGADVSAAAIDADVNAGWERILRDYFWAPTSLLYTCAPKDVQKADFYTNGFRVWEKNGDYGYGLEDCAIIGGVALSMLCDRFAVTRDESLREDARKIAQGLVNLCTVHGVKGFVARGICVEDGKSVCALSSIDQHTHCLHGLWRYWRSPLLDPALKGEIVRVVSEVADRMTEQVTEANDWSFQQAVGHGTTRGICKMRFNYPHEGARLAMFYAVAWDVSRNEAYRRLWRKYLDEALANSLRLKTMSAGELKKVESRMPNYTLLQMQTSLEVLYALAPDEAERARVRETMEKPAEMAEVRARRNRSSNGMYLCSCGELSLAQTMAPGFAYDAEQRRILREAIAAEPFASKAGCCRVVHLAAAWWRLRALEEGR